MRLRSATNQTKRNNEKLPATGFKQQPTCTRLPQQETKSSTTQLAPTDPILGPENLLKNKQHIIFGGVSGLGVRLSVFATKAFYAFGLEPSYHRR